MDIELNEVIPLGVIMFSQKAMDYLTKPLIPHMRNLLFRWLRETMRFPKNISHYYFLFCLPELQDKSLLLQKLYTVHTGPGGIQLELTWKPPS